MNDVLWVLTDACYRGKLKEVIHLLSGDHVDVNEFFKVPRLDVQWTPLTSAAMGGQATLVKILITKYGARVDNPNTQGMTALTAAAFAGFPEICQILLDHGANIEAPGLRGETALIGAASGGHGATVDLLMKHGANIESVDNDGRTALMKAAKFGCTGTVDLLVTRYGADCSVRDKDGKTAQMIAAEEGNGDVSKLIETLSTCPNIFEARKILDDLYKKVEAALDLQLAAEAKMDELMRQLCEEDKKMLVDKKEASIMKHIESEDLLVDYQRRLLEAGNAEEHNPTMFKEAVEIVTRNTRATEEEMLGFVRLVNDISNMLKKYAEIKEEFSEIKKQMTEAASDAVNLIEQTELAIREQREPEPEEVERFTEMMEGVAKEVKDIKTICFVIQGLQRVMERYPDSEEILEDVGATCENLCGEGGLPRALTMSLLNFEKSMNDATKNWPLTRFLPLLEEYLATVKSFVAEETPNLADRLGKVQNIMKLLEKPSRGCETGRQAASGSKSSGPDSCAPSADHPPTETSADAASESSCSTIGAMDTSQVLGLLEIKLDGDTYRNRQGKGVRAHRRSHRNWQATKRSSSEIAADLNTAEKIADLLSKSRIAEK